MKRYAVFALAMVLACTGPEVKLVNPETDFLVKNGRLVFNDAVAITKVINSIASLSEEELTAWELKVRGFSSLRSSQMKHGLYKGYDSEYPRALLSILNQQGVYQIGNEVVVFKGDQEIVFPDKSELDIEKVVRIGATGIPNAQVHQIKQDFVQAPSLKNNPAANQNLDARYQEEYDTDAENKYKSVFESYAYSLYGYIFLGVRIKYEHKQRNWYGWTDWALSSNINRREFNNLKFYGITNYPGPMYWEYEFPAHMESCTSNNYAAEAAVPGNYLGPFTITGQIEHTEFVWGGCSGYIKAHHGAPYSWTVGQPSFLWRDIYYGTPPTGGGGGGGGGGGEPPPSCPPGCVWGGGECVCA
jgi:hypothetical protein